MIGEVTSEMPTTDLKSLIAPDAPAATLRLPYPGRLTSIPLATKLDHTVTRPDPTSVTAVGKNWVESVCDSIAQKQRQGFSAAARNHMALVEKTIAKRIEKGKGRTRAMFARERAQRHML